MDPTVFRDEACIRRVRVKSSECEVSTSRANVDSTLYFVFGREGRRFYNDGQQEIYPCQPC
jgi:hypothetical protein